MLRSNVAKPKQFRDDNTNPIVHSHSHSKQVIAANKHNKPLSKRKAPNTLIAILSAIALTAMSMFAYSFSVIHSSHHDHGLVHSASVPKSRNVRGISINLNMPHVPAKDTNEVAGDSVVEEEENKKDKTNKNMNKNNKKEKKDRRNKKRNKEKNKKKQNKEEAPTPPEESNPSGKEGEKGEGEGEGEEGEWTL